MPFAGKYRIIDFALSNCVNSGIFNVAVLTQYQPRSLNEHIGVGPAVGSRPDHRGRASAAALPEHQGPDRARGRKARRTRSASTWT